MAAHKARTIRIVGARKQSDTLELPLVGRVAAGEPILSGGHVERTVVVDRWMFRPRPDFLLRVQGDSMIDDGILDGDLVAGRSTRDAEHGQTVIARVGEGITIKRLYRRGRVVRLLPRNTAYAPIDPDPTEDFAIEGIYCGLQRRAG
jgi:repressor LexA